MNRRIVTLRNAAGEALHCTLEEPPGGAAGAKLAALLLSPGIKTRSGPHRLHRKLAAPFIAHGIPVMRIDYGGLGDSQGDWPDERLEHIYRQVELGHCVGDARCALDWLESHCGIRRVVAGGLCGAAVTALQAAAQDPRIAALYAVGLPFTLHGAKNPEGLPRGQARAYWTRYLRKLAQPAAWLRLLSLESDFRLMWRLASGGLLARLGSNADRPSLGADVNPRLPGAFLELLASSRPALLLFGENDPLRFEFEEKILPALAGALQPHRALLTQAVVPHANHNLGTPAAVCDAQRATAAWLDAILAHAASSRPRAPMLRRTLAGAAAG